MRVRKQALVPPGYGLYSATLPLLWGRGWERRNLTLFLSEFPNDSRQVEDPSTHTLLSACFQFQGNEIFCLVISFIVQGLSFHKVLLSYQLGHRCCCYCSLHVDKAGWGGTLLNKTIETIWKFFFFWQFAFKSAVVGDKEASKSQGHLEGR